jgi:stage V sporulation protein G
LEITEIRIKLMEGTEDRLRAFCSITLDHCFVVRDLKIIDGTSGPFVAMPSRKLTGHCQRCGHKNHLRASYCNHCGIKLQLDGDTSYDSPQKLYADVAHPINSECREMIQNAVIDEFNRELNRSRQPGYRSRYDDEFADNDEFDADDATLIDQGRSRAEGGGPRRPHFLDAPNETKVQSGASESEAIDDGESPQDDDDGFGAGVF